MGKQRAKIKPLVPPGKAPTQARAPVTSLKLARKLTSKFHAILNRVAELKADARLTAPARASQLLALESEMRAMGGREAYQEASALATKHFRSSRVVFKTLVRLGLQPKKGEPPLQLFEIGAVNAQLKVCPWLATRAIDLRSCDPAVEQIDFFDVPVVRNAYDVIVCAMVVNCVPDAARRAEMLVRCRDHLRPGGLRFFAVPSRCVDMSSFLSRPMLEALLAALGFETLEQKRTPKISFYVLRRGERAEGAADAAAGCSEYVPRIEVRSPAAAAALRRLAPPVRPLPHAEQPVTGFTKTDFAISVPPAWVTVQLDADEAEVAGGGAAVASAGRSAAGGAAAATHAHPAAAAASRDKPGKARRAALDATAAAGAASVAAVASGAVRIAVHPPAPPEPQESRRDMRATGGPRGGRGGARGAGRGAHR